MSRFAKLCRLPAVDEAETPEKEKEKVASKIKQVRQYRTKRVAKLVLAV